MHRYTAYYHRDGVFFVSEMFKHAGDEEALRMAQAIRRRSLWRGKAITLAQLDRHVTVYEREKQDA